MSFDYLEDNMCAPFLENYKKSALKPTPEDIDLWNTYLERIPKGGIVSIEYPLPPFILHQAIVEAYKIDKERRKRIAEHNGYVGKLYLGYLEPICAVEIDGINVCVPHCDTSVPVIIGENIINIG